MAFNIKNIATHIQKLASTASLGSKSTAGEVGIISGDLYVHDGTAARKVSDAADNPVVGVASGYKIARGAVALDGSNPTTVATGLTTIVSAVACLKGSSTPGDSTSVLTVNFTGSDGNLDIYGWKNTTGTDPTLVASTGTETVEWIAIGT